MLYFCRFCDHEFVGTSDNLKFENRVCSTCLRTEFNKELIAERGGKCEVCGYDKCSAALEFHHLDPAKKSFEMQSAFFHKKDARAEAEKCTLLCANCHRELHAKIGSRSTSTHKVGRPRTRHHEYFKEAVDV